MAPEEVKQDLTHFAWVYQEKHRIRACVVRIGEQLDVGHHKKQWVVELRQAPGLRVKPALVLINCGWEPKGNEKDRVEYAVQEALRSLTKATDPPPELPW